MRFQCSNCSKTLQMSDALAGKRIRCPNCQAVIQTPASATPDSAPPASQQSAAGAKLSGTKPAGAKPVTNKPVAAKSTTAKPALAKPVAAPGVVSAKPVKRQPAAPTSDASGFSEIDLAQIPLPTPTYTPGYSSQSSTAYSGGASGWTTPRKKKPRGKSVDLPLILSLIFAVLGAGVLIAAVGRKVFVLMNGEQNAAIVATSTVPASGPTTPGSPPPATINARSWRSKTAEPLTVPNFPELGQPQDVQGVKLYTVDLSSANPSGGPGHAMQMRVYVPAAASSPGSVPCVLVAPAGTNMLHGSQIDAGDYHDETLPYAKAGMVVVHYSLDGPLADLESFTSQEQVMQALATAYQQFRAAQGGVINGRIALEFALARVPQVDPARIYCAGHSSAATVALQLAAHEPRIAKCAAYAPVTNLMIRLRELMIEPTVRSIFPDLFEFISESSPHSSIHELNCPVFLFHARDDSNEPWSQTNQFASMLKGMRRNCTFVSVDTGDHYEPMITTGIPRAIEWFQQ